jgi:hypothetical protein
MRSDKKLLFARRPVLGAARVKNALIVLSSLRRIASNIRQFAARKSENKQRLSLYEST